jgi:nitrate reductase NapE component
LRFERPIEEEAWSYNVLQRLAYLFVVFVLFPLVIWTGLAMSPAFVSAVPAAVTVLGGQQSARTIHFFVSLSLLLFLLVHVVMVGLAGFKSRMRAMITGRTGTPTERTWAISHAASWSQPDSRPRRAHWAWAWPRVAQTYGLVPPDHGGIYRLGETLTYASQRLLTRHSLARQFARSQTSKPPFANEIPPLNEEFKRLQAGGLADWRLSVGGMVGRPASFSLDQLNSYPC